MSYRLQKDESLASGLRRIAEEQLTGALTYLEERNIYEVRRYIKRIRSLLRLLKPQLGPIYIEENRRLRDVARRFSAERDLDVSLELLETFSNQYKRKSTLNPQRKALSEKRSALHHHLHLSESAEVLAATRKRIEDWPLHDLTPAILASQLEKTHKQSRHAFQHARETRTPEDFHEFRKSVKRELNQSRVLNSSESDVEPLKKLSTLLGDHHNLVVLMATLENTSGRLHTSMQRQLRNYETQIISVAAHFYEQQRQSAVA